MASRVLPYFYPHTCSFGRFDACAGQVATWSSCLRQSVPAARSTVQANAGPRSRMCRASAAIISPKPFVAVPRASSSRPSRAHHRRSSPPILSAPHLPLTCLLCSCPASQPRMMETTSSSSRRARPTSAHSQTTTTRHPRASSCRSRSSSRSQFAASLAAQNSALVAGSTPFGHSCPCQKQPWTNMTARRLRSTKSGVPGNARSCRR